MNSQKLLISVRGPKEAKEAVLGGAHIIDAEYPQSALGTPYPLNISSIRKVTPSEKLVATNIGEKQYRWSTAAQAALGVALAGVDVIKVGLAELKPTDAEKVANRVSRNVKWWFPRKKIIIAFFADPDLAEIVNPLNTPKIAKNAKVEGVLIDTFDKSRGKGLLDYLKHKEIKKLANDCHKLGLEAWIAGSITKEQITSLWKTCVDVICIREAACEVSKGRFGKVNKKLVKGLVDTIDS